MCKLLLSSLETNVRLIIEISDLVHVYKFDSFTKSNSYFSSQSIKLSAFLEFVIVKFHQE